MTTTYTPEKVREIIEELLAGYTVDGLNVELNNISNHIDCDDWADTLNGTVTNNPSHIDSILDNLYEEAYQAIHDGGEVVTRLEAKTDIDGVPHRVVWIPENVSYVHGPATQWEIAFADEDEPPFEGQFYTATGDQQATVEMCLVDDVDDLREGCMYVEPLEGED